MCLKPLSLESMTSNRSPSLRFAVLFLLGFFTLIAQSLLFRLFLTVYEGSELGVGIFFCSWLIWVAAGACIGRIKSKGHTRLLPSFDLLLFLYIPAFILQQYLILRSRELAGIASYDLFPFLRMLGVSLLANAPVSFLTGFLFTMGCEWMEQTRPTPVSHVYIAEALGSFVGGILVTLLLASRMTPENIFMLIILMLAIQLSLFRWQEKQQPAIFIPVFIVLICIVTGVPKHWTTWRYTQTWERLLPRETYLGHFTTTQADYLYGEDHNQFNVMAWESVIESIPNSTYGREIVAMNLAQNPTASNILVLGAGSYSICTAFSKCPQIEEVTWLTPDPRYPGILLLHIPAAFQCKQEKLQVPSIETQRYLKKNTHPFDMIILHLPDVTTLALNQYFTRDFYRLLKENLTTNGTISVRASGGENYMGRELTELGASMYATIQTVFPHIAIKPGDETWFIASPADQVSQQAEKLVEQYKTIHGAQDLFPATGLYALYPADRAAFQLTAYREVIQHDTTNRLINTDDTPHALLHALLFAGRQERVNLSFRSGIRFLQQSGWLLIFASVVLFFLLRLAYLRRPSPRQTADTGSAVDSRILIATTGFSGMALSIILMYLYQAAFGSIFLNIGLISSLFMAGIFTGSSICHHEINLHPKHVKRLLLIGLSLHILLCLTLYRHHDLPAMGYMFLFFACGLLNGIYIPVAATNLTGTGIPTRKVGSFVETADNLGGAAGGFLCGVILLPLFGTSMTLLFLAALLFINFLPFLARRAVQTSAASQQTGSLGYILTGIALLLLIGNKLDTTEEKIEQDTILLQMAQSITPTQTWHNKSFRMDETTIEYMESKTPLYLFTTEHLAPDIIGYNGPMSMALLTDGTGILLDFKMLKTQETPSYMRRTLRWAQQLKGQHIFTPDALSHIDALTGATLTADAMKDIIQTAGMAFNNGVKNEQQLYAELKKSGRKPSLAVPLFICIICVALILHYRKGTRPIRMLYLLILVLVAGVTFNIQYSLEHVFLLLDLQIPPPAFSLSFLLVIVVPILVILFGNIYCGYLCPFGAIQEFFGDLQPSGLQKKLTPSDRTWFLLRSVKYLLLFATIVIFVMVDNRDFLADPLNVIFSSHPQRNIRLLCLVTLFVGLFYKRFWCRVLCPTGAFLALINSIKPVRRFRLKMPWRLCDYGVTSEQDLDCICCDRCRHNARDKNAPPTFRSTTFRITDVIFIILTLSITTWWILLIAAPFRETAILQAAPREISSPLTEVPTAKRGQPKTVDMKVLRSKIEQHQLSDHEALHYQSLEPTE